MEVRIRFCYVAKDVLLFPFTIMYTQHTLRTAERTGKAARLSADGPYRRGTTKGQLPYRNMRLLGGGSEQFSEEISSSGHYTKVGTGSLHW